MLRQVVTARARSAPNKAVTTGIILLSSLMATDGPSMQMRGAMANPVPTTFPSTFPIAVRHSPGDCPRISVCTGDGTLGMLALSSVEKFQVSYRSLWRTCEKACQGFKIWQKDAKKGTPPTSVNSEASWNRSQAQVMPHCHIHGTHLLRRSCVYPRRADLCTRYHQGYSS